MSGDAPLAPLDLELGKLLAAVAPARRAALAVGIGRALRRSQATRIAAQANPDGSPFAPRKPRVQAQRDADGELRRDRRGRIKRRASSKQMFRKLRLARWLRYESRADELAVGFASSAAARIARVHQLGLRDRVSSQPGAPEASYPERILLGFSQADRDMILEMVSAAIDA